MNDIAKYENDLEKKREQDSCLRKVGGQWQFRGWRKCLRFQPPERIHGVWYSGWEEEGFVEGDSAPMEIDTRAGYPSPEFKTWIDLDHVAVMRAAGQPAWLACARAVAIEFIGRRPAEPMSKHVLAPEGLVIVDKLLSAKFLGQVKAKGIPESEQDCSRKWEEVEH